MSIRVEDLNFSYGKRKALQGVSFELKPGCFNALLGPNGAGKSTLFALLTRLNALQTGRAEISGYDISSHPAKVMSGLGVVFQQSSLDLDLSVKQNLLYHASLHGIAKSPAMAQIELELMRLDMLDRLNDKVRSLNGGHRRRVEIARALLHQPEVLLLDEPSVGLDPASRQALNQHVRQLCKDQGLTVLWATHLIEEIDPDDPVLLLHKGQLMANASGREICSQQAVNSLNEAFYRITGIHREAA